MSEEAPDHAATANNNTPTRHPEGRAVRLLSPLNTPHSQRRANKRHNQNNNARVDKVDDGIMHRNADIGHFGNVDGQGIDLPPNLGNMFDDDQELLSALASFAEAVEGSVTNENNNLADSTTTLEGDELGIPTPQDYLQILRIFRKFSTKEPFALPSSRSTRWNADGK
jgi:hypothetical protein